MRLVGVSWCRSEKRTVPCHSRHLDWRWMMVELVADLSSWLELSEDRSDEADVEVGDACVEDSEDSGF